MSGSTWGEAEPASPVNAVERGSRTVLRRVLSEPVPIPQAGIERALEIIRSGRLFRYGEDTAGLSEAALFEQDFAAYIGRRHAIAVNSCGCSLFLALKASGAAAGDPILCNAFTLAPVPGAIVHAGCRAVMVDILDDLTIDLADLERKILASRARILLLSYMRGHFRDLDRLAELCRKHEVAVVEDCAHTLGASWNGRLVGTFGRVACFSSQTFKHINSGEGGVLVTDDPELAARITVMSGSYMFYGQNGTSPDEVAFAAVRDTTPNFSMRMTNVAAALLRPQLAELPRWTETWNRIYRRVEAGLARCDGVLPVPRADGEHYVGSSIQFTLDTDSPRVIEAFVRDASAHGVFVKWFGAGRSHGFTSRYDQWGYIPDVTPCPNADRVLARLLDMRLPLTLTDEDCDAIARVIGEAWTAVRAQ